MTGNQPTQPRISAAEISRQYDALKAVIDECQRTLKGSNGQPGLVGRLDTLEKMILSKLADIATSIQGNSERIRDIEIDIRDNEKLTEALEDVGEKLTDFKADITAHTAAVVAAKEAKPKEDPAVVRWPYLLDKFLAPILVALIIAGISYLIWGPK